MYYADGTKMADGDNDDEIIVCQKDDGTYHYYYEKEFRREFKTGTFSLVIWMRQKMNIHWKAPEK